MKVPARWHSPQEWLRKIAEAVNQIDDGRINANSTVTLTENVATTTVKNYRVGKDSVILFMPLTANAAAEQGNGTMHVKTTDIDPRNNQFTINHANNAQTDRSFRYMVLGSELN